MRALHGRKLAERSILSVVASSCEIAREIIEQSKRRDAGHGPLEQSNHTLRKLHFSYVRPEPPPRPSNIPLELPYLMYPCWDIRKTLSQI